MDEDRKVYKFRWTVGIFSLLFLAVPLLFFFIPAMLVSSERYKPDFLTFAVTSACGLYFVWHWIRCFYRLVFVRNFLVLDKQKFVLNTYDKRNVEGYWEDVKKFEIRKNGWPAYVFVELYTHEDDLSLTPHERYYRIVGIPITFSYGTAEELLAVLEEYYRKYGKQ